MSMDVVGILPITLLSYDLLGSCHLIIIQLLAAIDDCFIIKLLLKLYSLQVNLIHCNPLTASHSLWLVVLNVTN